VESGVPVSGSTAVVCVGVVPQAPVNVIVAAPPSVVSCGSNRAVSVTLAPGLSVVGTGFPAGSML
jgi:hypothetical protein